MNGSLQIDLNDINQTVFCIPFEPPEEPATSDRTFPVSLDEERDLANGPEIRFEAYRVAWRKCLDRLHGTIRELYQPSIRSIVHEVHSSYLNVLPGLPYRELPVLWIINPTLGSSFLDAVSSSLQLPSQPSDILPVSSAKTVHFYPSDFPNITTAMRSITSGFAERPDSMKISKPSTSLAPFDIRYLVAWYKSTCRSQEPCNLVIILNKFEQFDSAVLGDVFHIFATQAELPVVFLLSSSGPTQDFLHSVYPRSILSLLRVRKVVLPSGPEVLEELMIKAFFDVDFEPDIVLGPAALEFLQDHFSRHVASADAFISSVQLIYLKHFTTEPLTSLVQSTPSLAVLSEKQSASFVHSIKLRLLLSEEKLDIKNTLDIPKVIDKLRREFYKLARGFQIGFGVVCRMNHFLENRSIKGLGWSEGQGEKPFVSIMAKARRDGLKREIGQLGMIIRKMTMQQLHALLVDLHTYFLDMPANARTEEQDARTQIIEMRFPEVKDPKATNPDKAEEISDWLTRYLREKILPLEDFLLWDIWYTGNSPPPSELLNPSTRASIVSGLLRPYEFCDSISSDGEKSLWQYPDTSILFKRYLDSGKMINVYDWFDSFKGVLTTQHSHLQALEDRPNAQSPKKRGKAKAKQRPLMTEEEEEAWKIEVQARFIRALHELDYLGFIKHTGRKADHVLRTVFEVVDVD